MVLRSLLFGDDGLLRSGWRFAVFTTLFITAGTVFGVMAVGLFCAVSTTAQPGSTVFLVVNGLVSLAVALAAGWLCGRYLERLPFNALGASFHRRWTLNFVIGLAVGAVTFGFGALLGIGGGGLSFAVNTAPAGEIWGTLFVSFLVFAAAAAFEEALFRGYILQTFVRSDLKVFGVVLTSLLFATVHNANPAASVLSWTNTFIAGLWFAVAYLKTRDLWFPFGLHLAWNWAQGSIFGVEVSGLTDIVRAPLLRETDIGPVWLTGGDYGIEGGIVTTAALVLSTLALIALPLKSSQQSGNNKSVGSPFTASGS